MAAVRPLGILNHIAPQGRFALAEALDHLAPGHDIDAAQLYDQWLRELDNVYPVWLAVPNRLVTLDPPQG